LPTELTVREIAVEFVSVSDVPVMTTATVPMAAVPSAVRVRVVESAVGLELNDAETPRGRPVAEKFTSPLNPLCGVTVIVLVPVEPRVRNRLPGDTASVKFGVADGQLLT